MHSRFHVQTDRFLILSIALAAMAACSPTPRADLLPVERPGDDLRLADIPFSQVRIGDAFWSPRIQTNRTRTIKHV
jgi:hypothetical protein